METEMNNNPNLETIASSVTPGKMKNVKLVLLGMIALCYAFSFFSQS